MAGVLFLRRERTAATPNFTCNGKNPDRNKRVLKEKMLLNRKCKLNSVNTGSIYIWSPNRQNAASLAVRIEVNPGEERGAGDRMRGGGALLGCW